MICTSCYSQGKSKDMHAGSAVVEALVYLFSMPLLCIPGMLYSYWRVKNGTKVCRLCGSLMIDEDSPRGKEILKTIQEKK